MAGGGGEFKDEGEGGFFCEDKVMVASTNPRWIQSMFDTLTGIFDRVGLRANFRKTVGIICNLCRSAGVRADKAYIRQMTGEGRNLKDRQREWFLCPECGK